MTRHVMIDLETLSTRKNAAIVQVAAVSFDSLTGEEHAFFSRFVCDIPAYAHVDPGTIAWWLQQDAASFLGKGMAEAAVNVYTLAAVLGELCGWLREQAAEAVWSHGATFDLTVLDSAFAALQVSRPWGYKAERDTRTLYALAPGGMPAVVGIPGQKHDALYDCRVQLKQVVGALAALRALRLGETA